MCQPNSRKNFGYRSSVDIKSIVVIVFFLYNEIFDMGPHLNIFE
jgi:hypothetical protein